MAIFLENITYFERSTFYHFRKTRVSKTAELRQYPVFVNDPESGPEKPYEP